MLIPGLILAAVVTAGLGAAIYAVYAIGRLVAERQDLLAEVDDEPYGDVARVPGGEG